MTNVKIMKEDYTKTKFPNNYFNSIFAIESTGYTKDIEDFINEAKRGSGGKVPGRNGPGAGSRLYRPLRRAWRYCPV